LPLALKHGKKDSVKGRDRVWGGNIIGDKQTFKGNFHHGKREVAGGGGETPNMPLVSLRNRIPPNIGS